MKDKIGAYKRTSINTASKEQILLMLYQAAIKNCKKAMTAIEENNIPKKGEYILCIKNNVEDGLIDMVHFIHKGRICSAVWTNIKKDYELIS